MITLRSCVLWSACLLQIGCNRSWRKGAKRKRDLAQAQIYRILLICEEIAAKSEMTVLFFFYLPLLFLSVVKVRS